MDRFDTPASLVMADVASNPKPVIVLSVFGAISLLCAVFRLGIDPIRTIEGRPA